MKWTTKSSTSIQETYRLDKEVEERERLFFTFFSLYTWDADQERIWDKKTQILDFEITIYKLKLSIFILKNK